jgi:putative transcriptional regulator
LKFSSAGATAVAQQKDTAMTKRNLFGDLMEGVAAMKHQRDGDLTLRTYKIEPALLPRVEANQGCSKPNPQAAALVLLVRGYPDTLDRLEQVASR